MKARDLMHADVVSVAPDDPVLDAAQVMLQRRISGVCVMDGGNLLGILTEADLLRRAEIGTARQRSRLGEFFAGPGALAGEYVRLSGRKVHEVMSRPVETVPEDADIREIVERMETLHLKRLPVMRGHAVVGMISRADILRAFVGAARRHASPPLPDEEIRRRLVAHLKEQRWSEPDLVQIAVRNGDVTLEGVVVDERQLEAFEVAAENIPGVRKVNNRLLWIDTLSAESN